MSPRVCFVIGTLLAGLGVALGAFGAHALKNMASPDRLQTFEIGVRYQIMHAIGLLALAWAMQQWPDASLNMVAWLFIVGIVLFSGSLYMLVLTNTPWLGAVTPLGGLAFICGWLLLAWRVWGQG